MSSNETGKILFVDDDPLSREGFAIAFGKKFDCILCDSAREAEKEMDANVSVAIIDIRMAGKNGFELCNSLKTDFPDLPVIFYSGYPQDKHPIDVINEHQPFAFVTKGGDLSILENAIQRARDHYQRTHHPINPNFLESKMGDAAHLLVPNDTYAEDPETFIKQFLARCKQSALLNQHTIQSKGDIAIPKYRPYTNLIDTAIKAIQARISIYLGGNKGTGKTVLPHYFGTRLPEKPFVYIDCHNSALTDQGFLDQQHLELANNGILFLDDIHRLSNVDQHTLLDWIEHHELKKNVSIIATGPPHLEEQIRSYGINRELLSEISSVSLSIPTLRELEPVMDFLIHYFCKKYGDNTVPLDVELSYFKQRDWLGNILELELAIRQYFDDDMKFDFESIPVELRAELISRVLEKCKDNVSKTAQYLGMKRPRLYQLIETYNIPLTKRAYSTKPNANS